MMFGNIIPQPYSQTQNPSEKIHFFAKDLEYVLLCGKNLRWARVKADEEPLPNSWGGFVWEGATLNQCMTIVPFTFFLL